MHRPFRRLLTHTPGSRLDGHPGALQEDVVLTSSYRGDTVSDGKEILRHAEAWHTHIRPLGYSENEAGLEGPGVSFGVCRGC